MIKSKDDLRLYLNKDFEANRVKDILIMKFTYSEIYPIYKLIKSLRYYEYYLNKKSNKLDLLFKLWFGWSLRKNIHKTGIFVFPNTIDYGVSLMHPGFRRIDRFVKIGKNCTLLPMVLFGKKKPGIENCEIEIGDNCYIGTGVTILGPVTLGDNVTIGAGAVVTRNFPSNCTIAGVPAKIIS